MQDNENKPVYEERDASFEADAPMPQDTLSEEELQDSILEDSDMTAFQKTIAKMSDKTWDLCQRICGVVLALLASIALFWENITGSTNEGGFSYSLIVAVVIALLIPNIIERRGLRKIPKVRTTMAIVLLICIVVYFLIIGVRTGFNFRA